MTRIPYFHAYGFWHWGEGLQTVLFTWYMTFYVGLSASEIGFYQALVLSPFLLFTIAGGVLTDRIGAGLSYVVSTALFGLLLIGYGLADTAYGFEPWLFFAYCVGAGVLSAVSNPAIDTFIPEATPRRAQENALLASNVHNAAKLTGNVTGLALPLVLALGGFAINGALMLLSVLFLRRHLHRRPEVRVADTRPGGAILARIKEHYRECPENLDILLSSAMLGLLVVPTGYILWPLTLRERFPEYGDLIALMSISGWLGAIALTWVVGRFSVHINRPGRVSLLIWGIYAGALTVLAVVPGFGWLCLLVAILGGVKLGKAMIYGKYIRNCPPGARGLLISVEQTAFWGLATVGTYAMGLLVEQAGLVTAIHVTAAGVSLAVLGLTARGRLMRLEPAV